MLCVEKIIVAPLSRRARISPLSRFALMGSKPENGSSKISSLGSWSTVAMNCTFWAIPLESSLTFLSHQLSMPNFSNHTFSLQVASLRDNPLRRAKNMACSPTFIFLYSPRSSGMYPMRYTSSALISFPPNITRPLSGAIMRLIIRSNVVFPAPLGPSKPYIDPSGIDSDTSSRATCFANLFVTFSILIRSIALMLLFSC